MAMARMGSRSGDDDHEHSKDLGSNPKIVNLRRLIGAGESIGVSVFVNFIVVILCPRTFLW